MTTISKVLIDILEDLTGKDFKRFKWYMTEGKLQDIKSIPVSKLDTASVEETVDLMVAQYTKDTGEVAEKILRNMEQNKLAEQLKEKLAEVQKKADIVVSNVAEASGGPGGPGAAGAPIAAGVHQNITASDSGKVQAPVINGGQFGGPVSLSFN